MQSRQQNQGGTEQTEGEISLIDIISFLEDAWKKLAVAAIAVAILVFAGWNFLGSYQAEYVLNHKSNVLNIVSWKTMEKSLSNLAAQINYEGREAEGHAGLYKALESEQWRQKM